MTTLSYHKISRWTAACVAAIALSSCGTHKMNYDFRELAVAAITLDMDIEMNDNHRLYIEAADWIGTPYRYGKEWTARDLHRLYTERCTGRN